MSTVLTGLVDDLAEEQDALSSILQDEPDESWSTMTPAEGWDVHDQVAHLAHFDHITYLAIAQPEEFVRLRDDLPDLQGYVDSIGAAHRHQSPREMLQWWQEEGAALRAAVVAADAAVRVPWFGPSMSLASKVTARIMETWAHGQDVADAWGLERRGTRRLRHVARIGVLALPNSFRTHGLAVPESPLAVVLEDPEGGEPWTWGDLEAPDCVSGTALDFCLAVTQRRHVDDTSLVMSGPVAESWMTIAQAFAGPAGSGRRPGQFSATRSRE